MVSLLVSSGGAEAPGGVAGAAGRLAGWRVGGPPVGWRVGGLAGWRVGGLAGRRSVGGLAGWR
ncbi:MAG: hypothetical protein LBG60_02730, partial [Bifidobacteriaceae bacterium]|nr:hypothetical protein [Bifidobacteriaceae bacterium]